MYFAISRKGKVIFSIGTAPVELTPEEFAKGRAEGIADANRQHLEMLSGKPSSKTGRDLYFAEFGFFETPFVIWYTIIEKITGVESWYSDSGGRIDRIPVRRK